MSKINCCVKNCSHHQGGVCYANSVTVVGESAQREDETCCSSYLNKDSYSKLTNNTQSYGPCDSLVCKVSSCTYNDNRLCQLDSIVVAGDDKPIMYTETACFSYHK